MLNSRSLACATVLFAFCTGLAPAREPLPAPGDSVQAAMIEKELSLPRRAMTVGLLLDGPPQRGDAAERFKAEVQDMLGQSYEVRFDVREGDWTLSGIRKTLDALLSEPRVEVVVTAGFVGSIDVCRRATPLPKPVIAARVVDSDLLNLPSSGKGSGVANLVYIAAGNPVARDLKKFLEMRPFARLAFLANAATGKAMEDMHIDLAGEFKKLGVDVRLVPAGGDTAATMAAMAPDTEAVYYGPTTNLSAEQFSELAAAVNARRLPSFSMMGTDDVNSGALATLVPEGELRRLARRVANYLQRIVTGTPAAELSVEFTANEALTINMETARTIGYSPAWKLTAEADLLNEEPKEVARDYNLVSAVQAAMSGNLDLNEKERSLRASAQNVPAARAVLLPQLDAKTTATSIGKELASSFQPERLWTGSLVVTQLVYDEMAHANVEIQKRLQEGLEHEYDGFELDIIQLASNAYFNVLRAKAFQSIQRANLRRTRANLDIARVREEVGVAGPGEVYRWQAQAAQNRIEVVNAGALRRAAEIQFNRVLNRPEQETFRLQAVGVNEDILLTGEKEMVGFLADPAGFALFCDYCVEQGLREAPELKQIDSGIEAGSRLYTARKRKYYVPTVGVQAEMKYKLYAGGKGTESSLFSGLIPGTPEQSMTVGIQGSLPLYTGGRRKAERIQARESLESLKLKRSAVAQKLEQRIRTAAEAAHASYTNVAESRTAAEAAGKSLELVTIGYGRGVASITDLLDAQTASNSADLGASSTVYNFMLALMEMYRSVGVFGFLEPMERRSQWKDDFKAWCAQNATVATVPPAKVSPVDAVPVAGE